MENSCIKSPAKQPLVLIKAWQIYATDGDICAAALLSFFEYWHNYKLDKRDESRKLNKLAKGYGENAGHDEDLFQFHTEEDLIRGIFGLYSGNSVRKSIKLLIDKNFISVHRNPNPKYKFDNTNFFLFHAKQVQKFIDNEYTNKPSNDDEEYYFDTEDFYEKFIKPKKRSKEETILDNGSVKEYGGQLNIEGPSRNFTGRGRKIHGTITKTTSETTTETTTEIFMPSQSSGDKYLEESVENEEDRNEKLSPDEHVLVPSEVALQVTNGLTTSPVSIAVNKDTLESLIQEIRQSVTVYHGNSYLTDFSKHKVAFYEVIKGRIKTGHVSIADVRRAFGRMSSTSDYSIMEFLAEMSNSKFGPYEILLSFVDIFLDRKVANFGEQGKAAKKLIGLLDKTSVTLNEIEDCFKWLPDSGRAYRLGLTAVLSALSEFDRVKQVQPNGRFVGGSLTAQKTTMEKSVETLQQRDYEDISRVVTERLAKKNAERAAVRARMKHR